MPLPEPDHACQFGAATWLRRASGLSDPLRSRPDKPSVPSPTLPAAFPWAAGAGPGPPYEEKLPIAHALFSGARGHGGRLRLGPVRTGARHGLQNGTPAGALRPKYGLSVKRAGIQRKQPPSRPAAPAGASGAPGRNCKPVRPFSQGSQDGVGPCRGGPTQGGRTPAGWAETRGAAAPRPAPRTEIGAPRRASGLTRSACGIGPGPAQHEDAPHSRRRHPHANIRPSSQWRNIKVTLYSQHARASARHCGAGGRSDSVARQPLLWRAAFCKAALAVGGRPPRAGLSAVGPRASESPPARVRHITIVSCR